MSLFQDDVDFIIALKEKVLHDARSDIYSSRILIRLSDAGIIDHVKVGKMVKTNYYMLTKTGQFVADLLIHLQKEK